MNEPLTFALSELSEKLLSSMQPQVVLFSTQSYRESQKTSLLPLQYESLETSPKYENCDENELHGLDTPAKAASCALKCQYCGKKVRSVSKLKAHLQNFHNVCISTNELKDMGIKCKYCGKTYESISGLYKHIAVFHQRKTSKSEMLLDKSPHHTGQYRMRGEVCQCNICELILLKCNMHSHLSTQHQKPMDPQHYKMLIPHEDGVDGSVCPICSLRLPNSILVGQHLKTTHTALKQRYEKLGYNCKQCQIFFKNRYQAHKHKISYHSAQGFHPSSSQELNKSNTAISTKKQKKHSTNTSSVALDHVKKVLPRGVWVCKLCSGPFKDSQKCLRHIRRVHNEISPKRYQFFISSSKDFVAPWCSKCDITFTSRSNLHRHCRNLHGKKTSKDIRAFPFYCTICKLPFVDKNSYRRHMAQSHESQRQPAGEKICAQVTGNVLESDHDSLEEFNKISKFSKDYCGSLALQPDALGTEENIGSDQPDGESSDSSSSAYDWLYRDTDFSSSDTDGDDAVLAPDHMAQSKAIVRNNDTYGKSFSSETSDSSDSDCANILTVNLLNESSSSMSALTTQLPVTSDSTLTPSQALSCDLELLDAAKIAHKELQTNELDIPAPVLSQSLNSICSSDDLGAIANSDVITLDSANYPLFLIPPNPVRKIPISFLIPVHHAAAIYYLRFELMHGVLTETSWLPSVDELSWKVCKYLKLPFNNSREVFLEEQDLADMVGSSATPVPNHTTMKLRNSVFCVMCGFVAQNIFMILDHCGSCTSRTINIPTQSLPHAYFPPASCAKFIPLISRESISCQYICVPSLMSTMQDTLYSKAPQRSSCVSAESSIVTPGSNKSLVSRSLLPLRNGSLPPMCNSIAETHTCSSSAMPSISLPQLQSQCSVKSTSPSESPSNVNIVMPVVQKTSLLSGIMQPILKSDSQGPYTDTISLNHIEGSSKALETAYQSQYNVIDSQSNSRSSTPCVGAQSSFSHKTRDLAEVTAISNIPSVHSPTILHLYHCSTCEKSFNSRFLLNQHIVMVHFKCIACDMILPDRSTRTEHVRAAHGRIACLACDEIFERNEIEQHILTAHIDPFTGLFHCVYCKEISIPSNEIVAHIHKHDMERATSCMTCTKQLPDDCDHSALQHLLEHESSLTVYACLVCKSGFLEPSALRIHLRCCRGYFCPKCCFSAESAELYQLFHKCDTTSAEGVNPLIISGQLANKSCKICWVKIDCSTTIKEHSDNFHGDLHFQCGTCGQRFEFAHQLSFHETTHRRWCYQVCPICLLVTRLSSRKLLPYLSVQIKKCFNPSCLPNTSSSHQRRTSSKQVPPSLRCPHCNFSCKFMAALNKHTSAKHSEVIKAQETP